jgi:hypothetical protein
LPLPLAGVTVSQLLALLVAVQPQPLLAVTVIVLVPPADVKVEVVGEIEYVHTTPACEIVTVCPPIVTMAVRVLVVVLVAAVYVTVPPPLPFVGETVNQLLSLEAVQAQPDPDVTVIVPLPPPAPMDAAVGESENVHAAAACEIVTVCPPIVTVAVRTVVPVFTVAVYVTLPLALPLAGDTVSQLLSLEAVHAQPDGAVTLIVPVPPAAPTEAAVGESTYEHGIAACEIVTVCPPIVNVAEREVVDVFEATV